MKDSKDYIEALTKDLVKLAILSNNAIGKGQFSGKDVEEVEQVLKMCRLINETFVKEEK